MVAGKWTPPFFALPAFEGVADSGSVTAAGLTALEISEQKVAQNVLVFAFFAALALVLWFVLPSLMWPDESGAVVAPAKEAAPMAAPSPAPKAAATAAAPETPIGAVRRGVTEVPPRRPTEVTATMARRTTK
jgi:hypothetical protein